jgi:transcriptional regulator with XRE-family HTH domain
MKPKTFPDLFAQAERHEDYWVAGAILAFTEDVVREMERQGMSRAELARRLGATPAYVTKILRGKVNFTLATMVRLARALGGELQVQLTTRAEQSALASTGALDRVATVTGANQLRRTGSS